MRVRQAALAAGENAGVAAPESRMIDACQRHDARAASGMRNFPTINLAASTIAWISRRSASGVAEKEPTREPVRYGCSTRAQPPLGDALFAPHSGAADRYRQRL